MDDARSALSAYEFAGFRLDPSRRSFTQPDGTPIRLRAKPFDALVYLVERAGELVGRDALLRGVWPNRVIEDNNLNQVIATLRRLVGEQHIVTVPGRGYQFVTPVRRVAARPLTASSDREDDAHNDHAMAQKRARAAAPAGKPRSRAPVLVGAVAAGVALAALFAFGPRRSPPDTLVGAAITAQPLTAFPGEEITPALEPNGTRVAFSWQEPSGNSGIFVTQVGLGEPIRLSDAAGTTDTDPAWSPNGDRIAFLRRHDPRTFDVMVMSALGGTPQRVYRGTMFPISVEGSPILGWTPDGRELLFTTARDSPSGGWNYGLHRLSVHTGALEDFRLDEPTLHYDTSPAVSPDGRWLAFTRFKRGERLNQVMLVGLGPGFIPTGRPQPLPALEPQIYHSLHWSSSSERLWFAAAGAIFEWPLDGQPAVVHTLGPVFSSAGMSIVARPSGARAAVVVPRTDPDLFAVALDPVTHEALGQPRVRAPSSGVDYHPRISPDGQWLAFISDRTGPREVWLAAADGSHPRKLTSAGQLIVGYPRWAPDSKSIAFHSSAPDEPRVIYRVDVESGVTTRLFNGCCPGGWSADGRSLYVTEIGDINYVSRLDIATGRRERLVEGETGTESADGRWLLFSRSRERGYFGWLLENTPGHGDAVKLVADYTPSLGGLAPVADGFYYIGLSDDAVPRAIRFYDYARREAKDVAPVPKRTVIGLTVTPDGRELMYAAVDGPPEADILLLDFASTVRD
jgi:Tol biopolymer transport system component/DNA-binding winged helix-turn-helix (wHTH) protein